MEEELRERALYRGFAGLEGAAALPDESTILRFRHFLEEHKLAPKVLDTINAGLLERGLMLETGTAVDATLVAAPSSTKNKTGERDPEMHQTKKGNQWHFGMKAHIGVDADSGLVHTVIGTAANVGDVTQAAGLLHGAESEVFADAGYQGVDKRDEVKKLEVKAQWHVAMRPGKRRALDPDRRSHQLHRRARAAQGEHPGQGRAPVPRGQAAVRLRQGALPRLGEEHRAADDAVRDEQSVDGAANARGIAGMSASAADAKANRDRKAAPKAV